jgi:fatty acid desaturase
MSDRVGREPVVSITDAAPSLDDEQRGRRRLYSILMLVHIAGFALAGLLYERAWWVGLVLIIATGTLPWIAVVLANDSPRRRS